MHFVGALSLLVFFLIAVAVLVGNLELLLKLSATAFSKVVHTISQKRIRRKTCLFVVTIKFVSFSPRLN